MNQTRVVDIDFSPLHSVVTQADRNEFFSDTRKGLNRLLFASDVPFAPIAFGFAAPTFLVFYLILSREITAVIPLVLSLGVLQYILSVTSKNHVSTQTRIVRISRFADANGLRYKYKPTPASHQGMIFKSGSYRLITERLIFPDGSEIGLYEHQPNSKIDNSRRTYGYVRTRLKRKLPHMVLDAKSNNFLLRSGLPSNFKRDQVLSLEGDFDKHYTLYVPNEYERDALYVFTPDVMTALIESGATYDAEIVDDEMFLYSIAGFDLGSQTQLQQIMSVINAVGVQLKDQALRYRDDRVGDFKTNIVAENGTRLQKGADVIAFIALAAVVVYIAGMVFWADTILKVTLAIWVAAAIMLAGIALRTLLRKHRT